VYAYNPCNVQDHSKNDKTTISSTLYIIKLHRTCRLKLQQLNRIKLHTHTNTTTNKQVQRTSLQYKVNPQQSSPSYLYAKSITLTQLTTLPARQILNALTSRNDPIAATDLHTKVAPRYRLRG